MVLIRNEKSGRFLQEKGKEKKKKKKLSFSWKRLNHKSDSLLKNASQMQQFQRYWLCWEEKIKFHKLRARLFTGLIII